MKIEEYMQGKWKQATCTQTSNTSNTEDLQKPTKLADPVAWQLRTYVRFSFQVVNWGAPIEAQCHSSKNP